MGKNTELQNRLETYRLQHRLTFRVLAAMLDMVESTVNRFINSGNISKRYAYVISCFLDEHISDDASNSIKTNSASLKSSQKKLIANDAQEQFASQGTEK